MPKLTNMKLSKGEQKELAKPSFDDAPRYPWGLQLHLGDEDIGKLGLGEKLPGVGERMTLVADVKVTSVGENEREGDDKNQSVELQITDMLLEAGESADEKASKLYPSTESQES